MFSRDSLAKYVHVLKTEKMKGDTLATYDYYKWLQEPNRNLGARCGASTRCLRRYTPTKRLKDFIQLDFKGY